MSVHVDICTHKAKQKVTFQIQVEEQRPTHLGVENMNFPGELSQEYMHKNIFIKEKGKSIVTRNSTGIQTHLRLWRKGDPS